MMENDVIMRPVPFLTCTDRLFYFFFSLNLILSMFLNEIKFGLLQPTSAAAAHTLFEWQEKIEKEKCSSNKTNAFQPRSCGTSREMVAASDSLTC